jgi:carboxylesterase type B
MGLADQVRRAVAWVFQNIARFGGDPNRLYLGGQSSGAHLAAVALTTTGAAISACRLTSSKAGCTSTACTI